MPIEPYSELTKRYVEDMMREGDDFSPREWFNKVRAEKRRSESALAPERSSDPTSRTAVPIFRHRSAAGPVKAPITLPDAAQERRSENRLGRRLGELSDIFENVREDRRREAIYRYLEAVFDLVTSLKSARQRKRLLRRAFRFAGLPFDPYVDLFAGIIRCTTGGAVDRKTVSKWSRALRFVAACKRPQTILKRFMKKMGGVNACAGLYANGQWQNQQNVKLTRRGS